MRAIVFDGTLRLDEDHPDPQLRSGEALIQVRLAGICNTDIEIARGYMGFSGVIGHEFVGDVVATADSSLIGRRVVGEINASCGVCEAGCGLPQTHCPTRTVLGILGRPGAMAEYTALPTRNLHVVPHGVPDEHAVFVEPLAAALEILEQVTIRPTQRVLLLGDGKLGQLIARVLRWTGAEIHAVGRSEPKRLLLEAAGVVVRSLGAFAGERFDVVVDATGSAEGFQSALAFTRPRGTLVLKSTVADGARLNLAPIVIDEISVVGSRCGPFAPALRALAEGRVDVAPLLSEVAPLADGVAAFSRAQLPGVLKVALRP